METTACTQHPEILRILHDLYDWRSRNGGDKWRVSDITDNNGYQYVDLVMEGGGTLGVALLGYVYVLEQMNIRFLRLAGTSAGSIVAMLLAGGGPIDQAKSDWLIRSFANKDFYDFVDGDEEVRAFIDNPLDPDAKKRQKARHSREAFQTLQDHYGLNPGEHFRTWLGDLLRAQGAGTLAELRAQRAATPPGIRNSLNKEALPPERWAQISVVAGDLTTGTKTVLPEMAHLYWADPEQADPADFVRASMSVPVFFYPFRKKDLPAGAAAQDNWRLGAHYTGPVPPEVLFVDGGTMSNFPIRLLHYPDEPYLAPTFGIKIGLDRYQYNANDSFGAFVGSLFSAIMGFSDVDDITHNPLFRHCIGVIDSGNYSWLDFHFSDEDKIDLFVRGARAASAFLQGFDWEGLRELRR